jgi:4-diphosphocytidyl-2-C-methyl-D-erythritol kinase
MDDAGTVSRFAPAKINLYLHVTGRRPDGYHLLDSLVAFASVGDSVSVRAASVTTLAVEGPFAAGLPAGADNLVRRAADLLGKGRGAALRLVKNLPVASGIGGGSSDAAACLLALRDLWRGGESDADLAALGLSLGADVPACLLRRPLRLSGIGEGTGEAPALPAAQLVLVNPGVPLATPAVFAAFRSGGSGFRPPARGEPAFGSVAVLASWLRGQHNDLEPAARFLAPPVDVALAALRAQPGCLLARMSGTGATCFGLFPTPLSAQRAAAQIAKAEPDWWSVPATWYAEG